jgi:hypothetical protein
VGINFSPYYRHPLTRNWIVLNPPEVSLFIFVPESHSVIRPDTAKLLITVGLQSAVVELKICYAKVVSLSALRSSGGCCSWKKIYCNSWWTPCGWGTDIVYDTVYVIPIVRTSKGYGDAVSNSVHGSFYTGPVKGVTCGGGRGGGKCPSNIGRRVRMSGCLCLSVHLSAWNIWLRLNLFFMKFETSIFRKFVEKLQVSLKSGTTLHENLCTFVIISRWIVLRKRNFSDKRCR